MTKAIFTTLLIILLFCCSKMEVQAEAKNEIQKISPLSIKAMQSNSYSDSSFDIVRELNNNDKNRVYEIKYSVNGYIQYGLMSIPKTKMPKNGYPVIIQVHGYVPLDEYSTINSYRRMFNYYSNSEFIIIKPDLRGHGSSEYGDNYDYNLSRLYYAEDVLNLTSAIKRDNRVDDNNIFLTGHSNGGDTLLRLLTSKQYDYKAASLWAPVCVELGLSNFYFNSGGRFTYGVEALDNPDAIESIKKEHKKLKASLNNVGIPDSDDISFIKNLIKIKTPFIIRHGDSDKVVPYSWSIKFKNLYKTSGNNTFFKLINYPNDNHNLSKNYFKALEADLIWFRSNLDD